MGCSPSKDAVSVVDISNSKPNLRSTTNNHQIKEENNGPHPITSESNSDLQSKTTKDQSPQEVNSNKLINTGVTTEVKNTAVNTEVKTAEDLEKKLVKMSGLTEQLGKNTVEEVNIKVIQQPEPEKSPEELKTLNLTEMREYWTKFRNNESGQYEFSSPQLYRNFVSKTFKSHFNLKPTKDLRVIQEYKDDYYRLMIELKVYQPFLDYVAEHLKDLESLYDDEGQLEKNAYFALSMSVSTNTNYTDSSIDTTKTVREHPTYLKTTKEFFQLIKQPFLDGKLDVSIIIITHANGVITF